MLLIYRILTSPLIFFQANTDNLPLKGPVFSPGDRAETHGVHMWGTPYFLKKRDGTEVCLFKLHV